MWERKVHANFYGSINSRTIRMHFNSGSEMYLCYRLINPGSHMSAMIGESLSVIIQGENSQRILLMSNHCQWSSPMSATYENQALMVHLFDMLRMPVRYLIGYLCQLTAIMRPII